MSELFRFSNSVRRDPVIEDWMHNHAGKLGEIAQRWFDVMRNCGQDVRELLHDGHPTACVGNAAFGYVNAFKAHVNVGFFRGAEIADPKGLLEGTGKFMRHVKLRPEQSVDAAALKELIEIAYRDMKRRVKVKAEAGGVEDGRQKIRISKSETKRNNQLEMPETRAATYPNARSTRLG